MTITPPQPLQDADNQKLKIKEPRSSNLELYRIICMIMIVAHHYVVCSGLTGADSPMASNPNNVNSISLRLFGMWGKTGINCFLMITGYFMCTSKITIRKFLKLLLQVYFYKLVLFTVFYATGYETLSVRRVVLLIMPFWGVNTHFVNCFIVFYLTIPFLSILVQNLTKRQHQLLLLLTLGCYTLLGSVPTFSISFNYVTWFGIIFFMASYIRLYPSTVFENKKIWGWATLASILLAMMSVVVMQKLFSVGYFFMADSNKFFAVLVAVCSFLWFKNINIKYSKVINAFGGATFGVLLIHAGSNAMLVWLWKDTVDVIGHYSLPIFSLMGYSIGVVLAIFLVCNLFDQLRIATLEKWFFNWYDNKIASKADSFVNNKILKIQ